MPRLIVSNARPRLVLFAADEQGGAFDFIRQIPLHRLGKDSEAVTGNLCVALLVAVIHQHHVPHQVPSVFRQGNALCPGL